MKDQLIQILIRELKYRPEVALITSDDLLEIEDPELKESLARWIQTREISEIREGQFDLVSLAQRMRFPSALLAIDMLRREPDRAKMLLKGFR